MLIEDLKRTRDPLRLITYNGERRKLGYLEANYFDLLWRNRGKIIMNEWAYDLIWPHIRRDDLIDGNRFGMLVKTLRDKAPGLINTVHGRGRYIPEGSGINIQRVQGAHDYISVKVGRGFPIAPPAALVAGAR